MKHVSDLMATPKNKNQGNQADHPLVSVIIPTWNGKHHLELCLPSLAKQTYHPFEMIVVDDASQDDTLEWLAKEWPTVRVVAKSVNQGFASGINSGLTVVNGQLIALLNNDTEAEPDWLEQLVRVMQNNPEAGMVASKLKLWDDRTRLHSAGDYYTVSGKPGNRGVWEVDDGRWDEEEWIFSPCAGAALYKKELFETIGGFDERFESYLEDIDLAWRAQLAGFRCRFAPRAIIYHRVSATGGGKLASFLNGRNWIYVLIKDVPGSILRHHWRSILRTQTKVTLDALRAWRGEAARARLRGQLAGILALPKLFTWRRATQKQRASHVNDAMLLALLQPASK